MRKIVAALLMLTSSFAFADAIPTNKHTGPYAELNVGSNLYYLGVFSSENKTHGAGLRGYGWNAVVGYGFSPTFGLEGGWMQNYVNVDHGTHHLNVPFVTTRFTVPLGDRFSFIAKLGLTAPSVPEATKTKKPFVILPYTGIGLGYAMTQNLDVNVQYQGAVYGIAGAGLASVGVTYHFD